MARSRRKYRRSASQSAASLLALALPAPIQRAADTRLGPLLMFIGVPAMLIFGLLQVNWQSGTPRLTINADKAQELKNQLNNLDAQAKFQQLEQSAVNAWNAAHGLPPGNLPSQAATTNYGTVNDGTAGYGTRNYGPSAPNSVNSQAPFPSTKPKLASTQPNAGTNVPVSASNFPADYNSNQSNAYGPVNNQNNSFSYQQQLYQQKLHQQQLYQQQLYQQQLYEQQLYQQQLAEQQMRPQSQQTQQQQWQPQQTNPNYNPQYDQYGRSSAGPAAYYTPNSNNAQGSLPTNNSGRY